MAPELHRLGLLTMADVASFAAAYCYAYGQWRLAAEAVARMADRDETLHGLLIKAKTATHVALWSRSLPTPLRTWCILRRIGVARTRLAAGGYAPPSPGKLEGLLRMNEHAQPRARICCVSDVRMVLSITSPHLEIAAFRSVSPDAYFIRPRLHF